MTSILGGLSPAAFLRDHWQKRPLLVRRAIPGFRGLVTRDRLLRLAERPDATSRLVIQHPRRRWERHDGPFGGLDASMLPASRWTLLVHGLESLVPGGWELLRRFDFIPSARVDDLMVSYAADGGGVGPHEDQYDVFLLQGPGRRRWRISTTGDHVTDPDAAIKVLANFRAEEDWILEPGDLLYLPPGVAHWGTAEGPCFTYSIGFLAPSHRELAQGFLSYVAANGVPDAIYEDPDLRPQKDPLEIGDAMIARVRRIVTRVGWTDDDLEDFLGRFLTMPKPRVRFPAPRRPRAAADFARSLAARKGELRLALPSRGLTRGRRLFLNGRSTRATPLLRRLLRDRRLPLPVVAPGATVDELYSWYLQGWVV